MMSRIRTFLKAGDSNSLNPRRYWRVHPGATVFYFVQLIEEYLDFPFLFIEFLFLFLQLEPFLFYNFSLIYIFSRIFYLGSKSRANSL